MSNEVKYKWELSARDKKGIQWLYNRENINQLCYAHAKAERLMRFSNVVPTTKKVNIFSTLKTATVDVNWTMIKNTAPSAADNEASNIFRLEIHNDGQKVFDKLKRHRQSILSNTVNYEAKVKIANDINAGAISKFRNLEKDFIFIRNTGATIVCASAGVIAATGVTTIGGISVAASTAGGTTLGVGATLKGIAKFQDTGSIAAATVESAGEVLLYCCGLKEAAVAGNAAKEFFYGIFTKVAVEGCKSYISGDSLGQAMAAAAVEKYVPLGNLKDGLNKFIKQLPCAAIVSGVSKTAVESAHSMVMDASKDAVKNAKPIPWTPKRPDASPKVRYVDDGYLNSKTGPKTGPGADEHYVKTFCLRPAR